MTRLVVALALVSSLLSAVDDVLTFLDSLRDPGPALASAMTQLLQTAVPSSECVEVAQR
ncbi:MAG TPA: hypothetical protein VGF24_15565 [Vicinamibacterales bacterium]|jgi:hypothetical protein